MADLKKLEEKYPKELVVIGVHSAKFTSEKETDNIRKAALRHELKHPIVNDADLTIWKTYGVRSWPSLVLIDPEGNIASTKAGEGALDWGDAKIAALIKQFDTKLNREILKFKLEEEKGTTLLFPTKIAATATRIVIADTNHNRVIATDPAGRIDAIIGSGEQGFQDGSFETAKFHRPHGVLIADDLVYIADTENHRLRVADLKAKTVATVAGTGEQGRAKGGPALTTKLNSPWDLARVGETLYIAMAGNHAIWTLNLKSGEIGPFSGDGRERLSDGSHSSASFSQPSGLAIAGDKLYVADSEDSGVREVDLAPDGEVRTLVGTGLFDFGDVDGKGPAARLQHPLGVAILNGVVLVADSYNHKLKTIDPKTREARTLVGDGKVGLVDGRQPRFHEPEGLAVTAERVYIADTNNHAIRVLDLKTMAVTTLKIENR
jgi:hypothetical protein